MSPDLVMYQCRMYALVAVLEGMKVDNAKAACDGNPPYWSADHFNGLQNDFEELAVHIAGLSS
jgi:hypothetical protein